MRRAGKIGTAIGAGVVVGGALLFGRETGYELGIQDKQQAVADARHQAATDCNTAQGWAPRTAVILDPAQVTEYATTKRTGDFATDPVGAQLMSDLGHTGLKKIAIYAGTRDTSDVWNNQVLQNEMASLENDITQEVSKRSTPTAAANLTFMPMVIPENTVVGDGAIEINAFQAMCVPPATTTPTSTK